MVEKLLGWEKFAYNIFKKWKLFSKSKLRKKGRQKNWRKNEFELKSPFFYRFWTKYYMFTHNSIFSPIRKSQSWDFLKSCFVYHLFRSLNWKFKDWSGTLSKTCEIVNGSSFTHLISKLVINLCTTISISSSANLFPMHILGPWLKGYFMWSLENNYLQSTSCAYLFGWSAFFACFCAYVGQPHNHILSSL